MPVKKTLFYSIFGVAALFAQAGAPEPAQQLSARDLFYAPTPPAAKKTTGPPAKQAAPKKTLPAVESGPPAAVEPPAAVPPVRDALPPVSSGGAQIIRTAYTAKPLGLRYSILRNNGGGDYRETAPDTVFHSGDWIRVAIEVNDAGYLYIAMKGASGTWKILFPTAEIAGGNNRVESGQQYTIPSAPGRFAFDQQPGEEQLFIVLSRRPESDLEHLIYSLGSSGVSPTSSPAQPSEQPKLLSAQARPLGDPLVGRLRSEVYARDLVFEKVDESTPGEKKENAVYVLNRTGSPDSRLVADFVLKHQ
ncbi:MAG: DUF4384 domain-containing protein [Bryobacteraceae bacterium]|jgi:hypothetical protein